MNNYLKSKLATYTACSLLVYYTCTCNQALASYPQIDNKKTESDIHPNNPQQLIGNYYTQALKQFSGFTKNSLQANNLVDSHGQINERQMSKTIDSLPIKNDQLNKSLGFVKGLVYNPSNPAPFFNNLIALQSMSAAAQSKLILWGEKYLGAKNSYVLALAQNYNSTLRYIEALKQQKVLLEQSIQATHK